MTPPTCHHEYPPFPDDIKTAPLVSVSLAKLENNDAVESTAFFEASKNLGFFYMNMEGSKLGDSLVSEAEKLLQVQKEFFRQPVAEKEAFAREKLDSFFGYRHGLTKIKDEDGTPRRNETYNVSWLHMDNVFIY